MDFSLISVESLTDFLNKYSEKKYSAFSQKDELIKESQKLYSSLESAGLNKIENLTPAVVDAYLATLYRNSKKDGDYPENKYRLSELNAMSKEKLLEFGKVLHIPIPQENMTQTDYEFLRYRIVAILFMLKLVDEDKDGLGQPNPESSASEFVFTVFTEGEYGEFDEPIINIFEKIHEHYYEEFGVESNGDYTTFYDFDDVIEKYPEAESMTYGDLISTFIKNRYPGIKRGDVISPEGGGYRNKGRYIYDGKNIVSLEDSPDDYGTLPKMFSFPEFPLNYWYGDDGQYLIDNNEYAWVNLDRSEISEELYKNLRGPVDESKFYDPDATGLEPLEENPDKYVFYTHLNNNGNILNFKVTGSHTSPKTKDEAWDLIKYSEGVVDTDMEWYIFGGS